MSTLVTIAAGDLISNSRTDINSNFTALNTDKIETSVIDTDTALAANSDAKIASQKAVKTYIDTQGGANASTTVRGIVEEATSAEMIAGTAAGGTGARLFLNPTLVAETGADKIVKTKSTGLLDSSIIPGYLTTPFYQQSIVIPGSSIGSATYSSTSNSTGSVLILYFNSTTKLMRFERDSNTGLYTWTHSVNATSYSQFSSLCVLGNYVYSFIDSGNNIISYRYDLATLANETSITMPAIDTSTNNYDVITWTDGTYIYLLQSKAGTTGNKLSISGTTFSAVTTSTTSALTLTSNTTATMYDGTNNYHIVRATDDFTIKKANDIYFSSPTSTTKYISEIQTGDSSGAFIINIDTNRIYIGRVDLIYDATSGDCAVISLFPVTKP